jgi:hypothetical protein
VLTFPYVLKFLADKFSGLRGGRLSLLSITVCALEYVFLGHVNLLEVIRASIAEA